MSKNVNTGVPGYTPQMLEDMGYNPEIDYLAEIDRYNELVAKKDHAAAREMQRRHGGMIPFVMKAGYQQQLNAK